jgi:hypothetical protein
MNARARKSRASSGLSVMSEFTDADKLSCATREVGMRRKVYRHWVGLGKMSQVNADREIALMEAIAADYSAKVQLALDLGRSVLVGEFPTKEEAIAAAKALIDGMEEG